MNNQSKHVLIDFIGLLIVITGAVAMIFSLNFSFIPILGFLIMIFNEVFHPYSKCLSKDKEKNGTAKKQQEFT